MILTEHYRANKPKVIHEIIDGEAIIVNLDNGNYYSVDKVGAVIWRLMEDGMAKNEIIDVLENEYSGGREEITKSVNQLMKELEEEDLIIPDTVQEKGENGLPIQSPTTGSSDDRGEKPRFEVPVLHKYNDMQDLLLLDPIHEVDEAGWPNTPPTTEKT